MNRGAWWATQGYKKSGTTEQLTLSFFFTACIKCNSPSCAHFSVRTIFT